MVDNTNSETPNWYGELDADTVGSLQNRGWDRLPPDQAAREAVKAYRNLERIQRTPPDQMLRLPKADDAQDVDAFWRRLGKPEKPEDYDFGDVNWDDNAELSGRFKEAARKAAAESHMPKEMAERMVRAIVDWSNGESSEAETNTAATRRVEEQELYQAWGSPNSPQYRANTFIVDRALTDLAIDQDTANAIRDRIGLKSFMETFHRIGLAMNEDRFVSTDGTTGVTRGPMTRDQAATALNDHKSDRQWAHKLLSGDKTTLRQWQDLVKARASFAG